MATSLIITPPESLQEKMLSSVKSMKGRAGVYVALNRSHKAVREWLNDKGVDCTKLFFIDCISPKEDEGDTIFVSPRDIGGITRVAKCFLDELPEGGFVIVDSLATLLIYNDENRVAQFLKETIEAAAEKKADFIALSPLTREEELLEKVFNFFDNVERPGGKSV